MRQCHKNKGFTLLEVMVAAVIGAFIALVAVGSLRAVTTAREQVSFSIAASDELRFAGKMLRNDFANFFRAGDIESMRLEGFVEGSDESPITSVTMYTVCGQKARRDQPEGDMYEVQYYLLYEEDQSSLMRRVCPVVGIEEDEETEGGMLARIAEGIGGFEVRYYNGYEWLQSWSLETEGMLPELVEVSLISSLPLDNEQSRTLMKSFIVNFPLMGETSEETAAVSQEPVGQTPGAMN